MSKIKDISGQKFGRLKAIKRIGADRNRVSLWLCQCECGNVKEIRLSALINGYTKSCGCYQRESLSKRVRTHGMSKDRLYKIYKGILHRCNNPKVPSYKNYGGRGIVICDEWENNFLEFKEWSMNNGYSEKLQIDRIDNNGNYCPENCQWTTSLVNQNSKKKRMRSNNTSGHIGVGVDKRNNKYRVYYTFNGKSYWKYNIETLEKAIKARRELEEKHSDNIMRGNL